MGEWDYKKGELFGVTDMFTILDYDDSFKGVYMSKLAKLYTLNYAVYSMSIMP